MIDAAPVDAAFFSETKHVASLARAASRHLLGGRPEAAFRFADRCCRLATVPSALHYLLRSAALRALGDDAGATHDLKKAAERDWADPIVVRTMIERGPEPSDRDDAARALLDSPLATDAHVRAALAWLRGRGETVVLRAKREGERVSGWAAWTEAPRVTLSVSSEAGDGAYDLDAEPSHRWASSLGRAAGFDLRSPADLALGLDVVHPEGGAARVSVFPQAPPPAPPRPRPFRRAPAADPPKAGRPCVTVVVPVYGDLDATRACLKALREQRRECDLQVVLIDDCSPDPAIATLVEAYCASEGATLVVHRVNHGFAASVNEGLALREGGDVLWLNADVILPPRAIERFALLAREVPNVGTIVPMSNDSELTSFPKRNVPNPLPPPDRLAAIDAAAFTANGGRVVDVPNGIGFCLYVTGACCDALGPLSLVYGRGYYEDVDYCLRAREHGFRNVAATGIYVGHASGRSFRAHKRGLVAHNYPILERRFPDFTLRCATFIEADPLGAARAAIEARLPPREPVALLVGRRERLGPVLDARARIVEESGTAVLVAGWARAPDGVVVSVRAHSADLPQSLDFPLEPTGREAFVRYLRSLDLRWIELAEPARTPHPLVEALVAAGAPLHRLVGDLESFAAAPLPEEAVVGSALGDPPPGAIRGSNLIPADRMARARCDPSRPGVRSFPPAPPPKSLPPRRGGPFRVIGVPLPVASPVVDDLLAALGRHLASADGMLVLLGRSVDDLRLMRSSPVFVTGTMDADEYPAAVGHYAIGALFLPYRTSFFGLLDETARGFGLPKAYFDWAERRLPCDPGDLAIDHRASDAAAILAVARWCDRGRTG